MKISIFNVVFLQTYFDEEEFYSTPVKHEIVAFSSNMMPD
jgi:hypothetical protein